MKLGFKIYDSAKKLPDTWDEIAAKKVFIKKDFLTFLEEVNYCNQSYHINEEERIIMVSYKLKLDLLTFSSSLKLNFNIRVVGIPLSIACEGFVCAEEKLEVLAKYLKTFPLLLVLNTDGRLPIARANTLGSYVMEIDKDFDGIFMSLKSRYRRRLRQALSKSEYLQISKLANENFQEQHYALYEQVYERSEGRLEKLKPEYFCKMAAQMYEIKGSEGELLAFFQIKQIDKEMVFLFCGVDKESNKKYDTYLNMLIYMVKLAYEKQCIRLHLGQTTGYSKSRLGAKKEIKYMHLASNIIPDAVCKKLLDMLGNKEDQ